MLFLLEHNSDNKHKYYISDYAVFAANELHLYTFKMY